MNSDRRIVLVPLFVGNSAPCAFVVGFINRQPIQMWFGEVAFVLVLLMVAALMWNERRRAGADS